MFKLSEHSYVRFGYYLTVILLSGIVLWGIYTLFVPLFFGFLLAFLTNPFVTHLERKGLNRPLGTATIFVTLAIIAVISFNIISPIIQDQVTTVKRDYPLYEKTLSTRMESMHQLLLNYFSADQVSDIENNSRELYNSKIEMLKVEVPKFVGSLIGAFGSLIFIPIIAFFFSIEGTEIKKRFASLLPNRYFEMVLMIIHETNNQIGGYIRGQFYDCLIIGILASIGLSILGVKGAIVIGLFAGAANAIPYLGPVVGAIPAIVILLIDPTSTSSWWTVPIVFLIVNILDNSIVYPMTIGKSLSLHPLIVILGILFGGSAFGIIGMIVAVPLIGIVTRIFDVWKSTLQSYQII